MTSQSGKYDAIVIGGGHNGLTCAAYLAKAGKKVKLVEKRHVLGGAAVTEEVYKGFHFSVCSYVVSLLRPQIIRDLELPRHGLEILPGKYRGHAVRPLAVVHGELHRGARTAGRAAADGVDQQQGRSLGLREPGIDIRGRAQFLHAGARQFGPHGSHQLLGVRHDPASPSARPAAGRRPCSGQRRFDRAISYPMH